jgi:hypothetical protein
MIPEKGGRIMRRESIGIITVFCPGCSAARGGQVFEGGEEKLTEPDGETVG